MTDIAFSSKTTQILEIVNVVLIVATIGFGVLYQVKGWKLEGAHLILVCMVLVNSLNLHQAHSARIDALEKRLSGSARL